VMEVRMKELDEAVHLIKPSPRSCRGPRG